jgi:hypothetical protein
MNKTIGLQLVIYSLLLAGLSFLTYHLAPVLAQTTLITGLLGGTFCLIWGFRAMGGRGGKVLPIFTLVLVNFFLLSQTFMGWWGGGERVVEGRVAAILITFLFLLSMGTLMRIAYAGMPFDGLPGRPKHDTEASPRKTTPSTTFGHGIQQS